MATKTHTRTETGITFTVRGSPEVLGRFTRLLAAMHLAAAWGSSRWFGMPLDGDGPERFRVEGEGFDEVLEEARDDVSKATGTGRSLVVAFDNACDSFGVKRH